MRARGILRPLRALLGVLLVLISLTVGGAAFADDLAKSKAVYKKGENAFALGDYATAASLFQEAYELSQRPQLLWNVAAAHRGWFEVDHDPGHLRRARSVYQNYASLIDNARDREEAQREIKKLDAQLAQLERAPTPPTGPNTAPITTPPPVTTPPKEPAVPVAAVTPPSAPAPAEASTPVYKKWWLWTIVGVAVAAGVTTGVVLGTSSSNEPPGGLNAGTLKPVFP